MMIFISCQCFLQGSDKLGKSGKTWESCHFSDLSGNLRETQGKILIKVNDQGKLRELFFFQFWV